MPWEVATDVDGCDGYAVVKADSGALVACHDDEAGAQDQVKALYANTKEERLASLERGIHLMKVELARRNSGQGGGGGKGGSWGGSGAPKKYNAVQDDVELIPGTKRVGGAVADTVRRTKRLVGIGRAKNPTASSSGRSGLTAEDVLAFRTDLTGDDFTVEEILAFVAFDESKVKRKGGQFAKTAGPAAPAQDETGAEAMLQKQEDEQKPTGMTTEEAILKAVAPPTPPGGEPPLTPQQEASLAEVLKSFEAEAMSPNPGEDPIGVKMAAQAAQWASTAVRMGGPFLDKVKNEQEKMTHIANDDHAPQSQRIQAQAMADAYEAVLSATNAKMPVREGPDAAGRKPGDPKYGEDPDEKMQKLAAQAEEWMRHAPPEFVGRECRKMLNLILDPTVTAPRRAQALVVLGTYTQELYSDDQERDDSGRFAGGGGGGGSDGGGKAEGAPSRHDAAVAEAEKFLGGPLRIKDSLEPQHQMSPEALRTMNFAGTVDTSGRDPNAESREHVMVPSLAPGALIAMTSGPADKATDEVRAIGQSPNGNGIREITVQNLDSGKLRSEHLGDNYQVTRFYDGRG